MVFESRNSRMHPARAEEVAVLERSGGTETDMEHKRNGKRNRSSSAYHQPLKEKNVIKRGFYSSDFLKRWMLKQFGIGMTC